MPNYVLYRDNLETLAPSEPQSPNTIATISTISEDHRHTHQTHARNHGGVLQGRLVVEKDLPNDLAQGIFANPGSSDVIIHLTAPSESASDATIAGMSIESLAANISHKTGDIRSSGKLLMSGHKCTHPMAEEYHSQAPVRYGNTIAKFAIVPSNPGLLALKSHPFSPETPNALREAVIAFFHSNPAEFDLKVQLIAGAEVSPYRTVARLIIPAHNPESLAAEHVKVPTVHPAARTVPQEPTTRLATSVMSRLRRRKNNPVGRLNILPI